VRKFPRFHVWQKPRRYETLAKTAYFGVATAAEGNHRPAGEAEGGAGGVYNLEFTFDGGLAVGEKR